MNKAGTLVSVVFYYQEGENDLNRRANLFNDKL